MVYTQTYQDNARSRHMRMDGAEEIRKLRLGAFATRTVQVARQRKHHVTGIHASGLNRKSVNNNVGKIEANRTQPLVPPSCGPVIH